LFALPLAPHACIAPSRVLPLATQGKDSIRYLQEHEVMPEVFHALGQFAAGARRKTAPRARPLSWLLLTHNSLTILPLIPYCPYPVLVCRQKSRGQPV
jgi:hypothetical protein